MGGSCHVLSLAWTSHGLRLGPVQSAPQARPRPGGGHCLTRGKRFPWRPSTWRRPERWKEPGPVQTLEVPRICVDFRAGSVFFLGLWIRTPLIQDPDYYSKLRNRAVAYINVDISVYANATLRVLGTPPAQNVVFAASKQVKNPSNSLTVYDNWRSHSNRTSPQYGVIPQIGTLGIGSDYAPFMHYLGITCMDIAYTYDRRVTSARIYPTYHTAFDTFDYTARHIDPGFTSHQTVARTAGNVLLRLSDSLILPLGVKDYVETLESYYSQAESFQTNLSKYNISLAPLRTAITRYKNTAEALEDKIKNLSESDKTPYNIRRINDQLMLLERAFTNDLAFPDKLYFSHVLWASRTSSVVTFPGLADAYQRAVESNLKEHWDLAHHQLTIAIQAVDNAASTLEEVANI